MSYVYGVFFDTKWTLLYNKRRAVRLARATHGAVYRNRYMRGDVWDAVTFAHVGDLVADYSAED